MKAPGWKSWLQRNNVKFSDLEPVTEEDEVARQRLETKPTLCATESQPLVESCSCSDPVTDANNAVRLSCRFAQEPREFLIELDDNQDQKSICKANLPPHSYHYQCNYCDYDNRFENASGLISHITTMHFDKQLKHHCSSCNKDFESIRSYKRHVTIVHRELKPHKCELCEKSFTKAYNLKIHISATHDKLTPFKCSLCDKGFARPFSLKYHTRIVHNNVKPHQCDHCKASFGFADSLNRHIRLVHNKIKLHRCIQCQKNFGEYGHLKRHIEAVHEKRKPYKCNHCSKSFGYPDHLQRHVNNVHDERRFYKCGHCGEIFEESVELSRHVKRWALGEKFEPFQCGQCDSRFGRISSLGSHIWMAHKITKPFQCSRCGKRFEVPDLLKNHIKTVHDEESSSPSATVNNNPSAPRN